MEIKFITNFIKCKYCLVIELKLKNYVLYEGRKKHLRNKIKGNWMQHGQCSLIYCRSGSSLLPSSFKWRYSRFKGTVARDCRPLVFFNNRPHMGPWFTPSKIFLNSVSNSQRYSDLYVYQRCRIQRWFEFYLKIGKDFYFYFFNLGVL
jgi:hypothetical protein